MIAGTQDGSTAAGLSGRIEGRSCKTADSLTPFTALVSAAAH
jgi:hypothetical protein